MIFGTGYAPFRGGPLNYARTRGTDNVVSALSALAQKFVRHRVHNVREDDRALVGMGINAPAAQDFVSLSARGFGVQREFQIVADGFRLQPPDSETAGDQEQGEKSNHARSKRIVTPRCGCASC